MSRTPTAGITVDRNGRRTINKEYRGVRVFLRLGAVCQEHAERRLAQEIDRLEWEVERRAHARPLFSDCCNRFLAESKYKRTKDTIAWHVAMLLPYVGDLDVRKVHDETLRPFIDARLAEGKSHITINRTLEVVRTILNRAARTYRDADGFPWLETAPPLITMLPESPRLPHPINWDEQDRIFRRLPDHLARMGLFAINTCLRDSNSCGLQWSWEVPLPELQRSVFVVPAREFKSRRAHVVILNDAARGQLSKRNEASTRSGCSLLRQASERYEQHGVAAGATRGQAARCSSARFTTHLRDAPSRRRCDGRRSRRATRSFASNDAGALRERRHWTARRPRQSRARSRWHDNDPAPCKRLIRGLKQAMRDPRLWIKGRAKVV